MLRLFGQQISFPNGPSSLRPRIDTEISVHGESGGVQDSESGQGMCNLPNVPAKQAISVSGPDIIQCPLCCRPPVQPSSLISTVLHLFTTAESFLLATNGALPVLDLKNEGHAPKWGKGKGLRGGSIIY